MPGFPHRSRKTAHMLSAEVRGRKTFAKVNRPSVTGKWCPATSPSGACDQRWGHAGPHTAGVFVWDKGGR